MCSLSADVVSLRSKLSAVFESLSAVDRIRVLNAVKVFVVAAR
ncbi:hypothetical protein [Candidatus Mycobacterium methanotrophicum]|nr:hypothetical protein [Candidatus Mycobacterium methanotrophicum]